MPLCHKPIRQMSQLGTSGPRLSRRCISYRSPEKILADMGAVIERYEPSDAVPLASPQIPLETVRAASLASQATPRRAFLDSGGLFPCRDVSMISGDGGTSKTLLAMQLSAAVATGTTWLGLAVTAVPSSTSRRRTISTRPISG